MIVLSCKLRESIRIGKEISVMLVSITGDAVRLAVDAPKNLAVQATAKFETFQGGMVRSVEEQRTPPARMTIAQRLRGAIGASGQGLDRIALQANVTVEQLENFVRKNEDLPLSVVQKIANHFRLELTGGGG
ncbi:MAG TPA: carbon storage regulator [Pirellulales bacterium]|nr:carbon storage regulator [Pirellulales bacterium]